jgi:hypothetical protein
MATNNRDARSGAMPTKFDADTSDQVSQEGQKEGMRTQASDLSANSKLQPGRPTPSPSTEKVSGAGPAIAEHSKDAKAPKGGRQPGAYIKK